MLPKKAVFVCIAVSNKEKRRISTDIYARVVRQQIIRQKTTMAKTETLSHYLYFKKISEIAKTTEDYSDDKLRSNDVKTEVLKPD